MNMENIEAYLYVAHFQNVHRAARALYLSQPSVTARIKSIEKELNVQLFTRKGRGIEITAQGAEFLPFAEQIFKTYQQGKNMMQKQEHSHEELVIGANGIATRFFLPYVLPIWRNQLDYIRIKTISGDNEDILNKLIKKEVDVAFVRGMEHPLVTSFTLLKNQIQLAVKQEHSLLRQSSISVDDLASEPMVFFECGAFDWSRIRKMFDVHHTRPPIDYHVDDLSVATKLISAGKGIGFLPELCMVGSTDDLALIDVTHLIQIHHDIQLAYLPDHLDDGYIKTMQRSAMHYTNKNKSKFFDH